MPLNCTFKNGENSKYYATFYYNKIFKNELAIFMFRMFS